MNISQNALIAAGGAIAILIVALIVSRQTIAIQEETIRGLMTEVELIALANDETNQSLDECQRVNQENAKQREDAESRAAAATVWIAALERELEEKANEPFDNDEVVAVCRRMDEPLPRNFLNWLCIDGAANCSQDSNADH